MPFKLREDIAELEAPRLAHIKAIAFQDNPLNQALFPIEPRAIEAWFGERTLKELRDPHSKIVAVTDTTTNEVVAYAHWTLPHPPETPHTNHDEGSSTEKGSEASASLLRSCPKGTNLALYKIFRESISSKRNQHVDPERNYVLGTLATHPDHQGKGLGSMLISWGIKKADAVKARTYLESTPGAHTLYKKHGFRDVDEIQLGRELLGGMDQISTINIMVRDAVSA